jgi:hypothetical protein
MIDFAHLIASGETTSLRHGFALSRAPALTAK